MADRSGIICAGNWIVDLIHEITHWPNESDLVRIATQTRGVGGGPANVIGALAQLETGLPLWPMGALGDDAYGDFVLETCRGLGLPIDQLARKAGMATAHTHVMSVPGRSRTFFYQGGANDVLSAADFPVGTFSQTNAKVFYLGYLTLLAALDRVEGGATDAARLLARAREAGLVTCVDLVSAEHPEFEAIVATAAPHIDYLILNEVEAARAVGTSLQDAAPEALQALGAALVGKGVRRAVIVHSASHVRWAGPGGEAHAVAVQPLPPAEIASHLGAGDAFCAGLLYALHEGWAPPQALDLATRVARASLRGVTANSAIPPLSQLT